MIFRDPRQVTDPHRIARFADTTYIRWAPDHVRGVTHGYLMPGGDHLLAAHQRPNGLWEVETDTDAVFDVGYAAERLTVPGQYTTSQDAMGAAERELCALLRRVAAAIIAGKD